MPSSSALPPKTCANSGEAMAASSMPSSAATSGEYAMSRGAETGVGVDERVQRAVHLPPLRADVRIGRQLADEAVVEAEGCEGAGCGLGVRRDRYLEQHGLLKLFFPEGEIDFAVSGTLTRSPTTVESVLGREVLVETSIEIIAKKVWHRGVEFTARDIFDLALVSEKKR